MFSAIGNPGYKLNNVLTALPSYLSSLSNPNNMSDLTKHISGLDGNFLPGKTILYYAGIYAWADRDISEEIIQFFVNGYNNRTPILWIPHIEEPLINYYVYVKYLRRIDVGEKAAQNGLQIELQGVSPIERILTSDDVRIINSNVIII